MALANIHAAEPASLNFSRNRGSTVFGLTAAVISLSTYSERRHAVKFNDAVFRTALVPWKKGKMTVNNKDQSPAGNAPKQHLTKDEMREKIKASLAAKEATEFQPSSPKPSSERFSGQNRPASRSPENSSASERTRSDKARQIHDAVSSGVHHSRSTSSVPEATWQQHSVRPALHRPDITNQCGRSPTPERSASSLVLPCWLYSC